MRSHQHRIETTARAGRAPARTSGQRLRTRTIVATLVVALIATSAWGAGTYTVDRSTDTGTGDGTSNSGSLSYVINLANGDPGSTIIFSVATVSLSGTAPAITANTIINGLVGGNSVVIQGNNHQAFTVNAGLTVSFSNMMITGSHVEGGAGGAGDGAGTGGGGGGLGSGGGIYVASDNSATVSFVTLNNVQFTNNSVKGGDGGAAGTGAGTGSNLGGAGGNFNAVDSTPGGTFYNTGGGTATTGNGNGATYGGGGSGAGTSGSTGGSNNNFGGGNGGAPGVGGGGGNGLGGAIFIANGSVTTFSGNSSADSTNTAAAGLGNGAGTTNGGANGGGIYVGIGSTGIFDNSTAQTYSGDIYNNGQVIIQGTAAGTITFTGNNANNSTSSAAVLVSTGTLAGTTLGIEGNVTNNSHVLFSQNGSGTFFGTMVGTGDVTITSSGTIVFNNGLTGVANSYSGGTTILSGALQGNTDNVQGNINVATNSAVIFSNFTGTTSGTYAGNMFGGGAAIINASGVTVNFTGSNTYSGGTAVLAGTLSGTTAGVQGNITNESNVTFNQATNGTYSGNMSGTGSVNIIGTGTVNFTGTNNYTGGTTVSGGTLSGTTTGIQGNIVNNTNVTFAQTTDGSYTGNMSGSGTVAVNGTATVTVSGVNSYNGGTTVTNGTLAGTTSAIQGNITNNANVNFSQSTNGAYTGNMTGTGNVYKSGSGTTTFSGTNNYSGTTEIQGGTLFLASSIASNTTIDAGGTLGGNSTITGNLTNNGTIAQAGSIATLTVTGTLTDGSSSNTVVRMSGSGNTAGVNNDLVSVGGNVTLGGHVKISPQSGTFAPGTVYTFLNYGTSGAGSRGGTTFADITSNSPLLNASLVYDDAAKAVEFVITTNFANAGGTYNQQQVGSALDQVSASATGDLSNVINAITGLDTTSARRAFSMLGGEIYGTTAQLEIQNTVYLYQLLRRAAAAPDNDTGSSLPSLAPPPPPIATADNDDSDKQIALVSYDKESGEAKIHFVEPRCRTRWQGSFQGYGLGGNVASDGNASSATYGFGGSLVNLHRNLDDCTRLGAFAAYSSVMVRASDVLQTNRGSDGQIGTYLRRDNGRVFAMGAGSVGFDGYSAVRAINFGGIDRTATGRYSGWQATAYGEIGTRFNVWRSWMLEPYAGLQYIYLRQNALNEGGANSVDLVTSGNNTNALRNLLGTRLVFADRMGWFRLAPGSRYNTELRATWLHEYNAPVTTLNAVFAGSTGVNFATQGLNFGRNWAILGGGFGWDINPRTRAFVNYDLQVNSLQTFHVGSGGLTYSY
ncbi:MAG: autotransporter domain-containing protein [Planctomycetes bacterium]|nr:autotransporter domain-containing protein [Planctomycetota bacterium]